MNIEHVIAFSLGLFAKQIIRAIYNRFMSWKFENEFRQAVMRMARCSHESRISVSIGSDITVDKCITCWALNIPNHGWNPNMAPPGAYERKEGFNYFEVKHRKIEP